MLLMLSSSSREEALLVHDFKNGNFDKSVVNERDDEDLMILLREQPWDTLGEQRDDVQNVYVGFPLGADL